MKQVRLRRSMHKPKQCIVIFLVIISLIFNLLGCATVKEPQYDSQPDVVEIVPTHPFDLPSILTGNNRPIIDVVLLRPGDVSEFYPSDQIDQLLGALSGLFGGAFMGAGAACIGILLSPGPYLTLTEMAVFVAAGGAIGGLVGAILGADAASSDENEQYANVKKAFHETDFSGQIQLQLERHFSYHFTAETDGNTEIEFSIRKYGLSITRGYRFSFNFEAEIRVKHEDGIIYQDFIYWKEDRRSEDLPPPRSEHLFNLAEADGKLVNTILEEASEVIATVVLKRLRVPYRKI